MLLTLLLRLWQDVSFIRSYSKTPTVLLTAKHSTSGGNAAEESNGIASWIEVAIKDIRCRNLIHSQRKEFL